MYLGSAIAEIREWYNDSSLDILAYVPWLSRGGTYDNGINAGTFNFYRLSGNAIKNSTFRSVISYIG